MENRNNCRNIRKSNVKSIGKIKSILFLFLGLAISANVNAQITLSATAASAVGVSDGQAIVQATTGVGNYTYTWTNVTTGTIVQGPITNALLSDTLFSAVSGSYILTFTDNGASTTLIDTITVTAPGGSFSFDKDCLGDSTDVIAFVNGCTFLSPVLGTQYVLTDASLTIILDTIVMSDSVFLSALMPGTYTITALNLDNGCTANGSVTTNVTAFVVNATSVNTLNPTVCDGSISSNVLSGQFPYTFTLTNSSNIVVSSTVGLNMNALSLCDDIYCLNVEDANGCTYDECLEVDFIPCDANLSVFTPIPCNGGVGDIEISVDTNNLPAGPNPYTLRYIYTLYTTSPYAPVAGASQASNNNSHIFTGLTANSYTVTVQDLSYGSFCSSDSVALTQPSVIQIFTSVDSTSAPWISDGQITIDSITGGTPGFAVEWYDPNGLLIPGTGMTQTGLSYTNSFNGGGYSMIVTDTNGCVGTNSEFIHPYNSEDSLRIDSSDITHVTCFGDCDGQLWAQLDSVGTYAIPPFTFEWKNAAGTIIRTDVFGSASYNIDHSAKYSNICAGTYSLTITDFYNNTINFNFPTVTEPPLLTLDLGLDFTMDCGEDTVLTAVPVGGNPSNDTILFSTHTLNLTGTPLGFQDTLIPGLNYIMVVSGTYTKAGQNYDAAYSYGPPFPVINWDINGNPAPRPSPDVYNLAHSYSFPFVATTVNTTFSFPTAGYNGTVTFELYQVNLNIPYYNYSWTTNPPSAPLVISNTDTAYAYPGTGGTEYILDVEDVLGCSTADAVTIDWNLEILSFTSVNTSNLNCNGDTLAYVAMAVDSSAGFSPYTFYVDDLAITGDSIANLPAGDHILHIEDAVGCISTDSTITVYQPDSLYACGVDTAKMAVLVETFTMNANALLSHTLIDSLALGVEYKLVVSGTYSETWGAPYLDAAYQFNVSPQLATNNWMFSSPFPTPIRPTPDVYDPTHTYEYSIIGTGNLTTFSYSDADYSDNSGSLLFELYKMTCNQTDTAYTCFGDSTGTAFVTPVGGTPFTDVLSNPYDIEWTDNLGAIWGNSATVTGLPAGSYTATITDSLGCSYERYLTVLQSNLPLQIDSLAQVNVLCKGDTTGEIFALVSGGFTTSYAILVAGNDTLYNVSGVLDTIYITDLIAGTYNLYLYDTIPDALYGAYGCPQNIQINILEPQNHLSSTVNLLSDVPCFGDSTGVAVANAAGGQFPYTYLWIEANVTGPIANNLWAGWHTVEITDFNGCTLIDSIEIINLHAEITASIQIIQQVSCFGACDAIVELSTAGGVLQHHYDWDIGPDYYGSGPDTNSSLCYGGHDVIVSDALGCQKTFTFNITQPDELFATAAVVQEVQCYGFDDGMAVATGTGGTPAYTFVWDSINGPVGPNIDSLTPGVHTVYLTDANGCTASDTVMIFEPAQLEVEIIDSMTVYSYCLGTNSGQLCAIASGGTLDGTNNYTYMWSDGQTGSCAYNLIADIYTVIAVDDRGCTKSVTFDLDSITSSMNPDSVDLLITDVSCFGGYDGSVAITNIVGATAPLTYSWTGCNGFSSTLPVITSLVACSYSVIITDSNGCAITVNAEVGEPDELRYTTYNVVDETCYGACDGQIWVYAEGGTGNYYYDLSESSYIMSGANKVQLVNDSLIFNLCAREHDIYLTDDNGCEGAVIWNGSWQETVDSGVVVTIPGVMTNPASCSNSNDGEAWIAWPGADPLFTYTWETHLTGFIADTGVSTEILYPGVYALVAHYADSASFGQVYQGCNDTVVFTISAPMPIVSNAVITDVNCYDEANGGIVLNPSGGMGTFTFLWDVTTSISNYTQQNQSGLLAGTYTVTITDTNGCELTEDYVVAEPDPITASITFVEPLCYGSTDGSATITVDGGIPPYVSYAWIPGGFGATVNNLSAGDHDVTVTDLNGCQGTFNVTITQPAQIISSVETNSFYGEYNGIPYNISCHGSADGSAIVYNGGGVAPLTYLWDDPSAQTTAQATALAVGTYSITVTDANSCTETQSVTLIEPDTLVANGIQSGQESIYGFDISCYGLSDGWIELVPSNGVTFNGNIYQYDWTGPQNFTANTAMIENVIFGAYDVTITDANGCEYDTSFVLTQPLDTFIAVVSTVNYAGPTHPPVMVMFEDKTTTLNNDPIGHVWMWGDGIESFTNSGFNTFTHTFAEIGPNEVYVLVQNANTGCIDSVTFIIEVQGIPELNNVFTPNGDAFNDEFIFGEYGMTSVAVNIYNRWGEQVYSWEGDNKAWDGKGADGQNLPEAVYFYVFKADGEDGHYYEEKGSITLIR